MYRFIRFLARRHRIVLVHFAQGAELDFTNAADEMADLCEHAEVIPLQPVAFGRRLVHVCSGLPNAVLRYHHPRVQDLIRALVDRYQIDLIHTEYLWMAEYVRAGLPCAAALCEQEIHSRMLGCRIHHHPFSVSTARNLLHYLKYRNYEKRGARLFDLAFATTEEERNLLQKVRGSEFPVEVYPNVVDTDFFRARSFPASPHSLIFVANFRHPPNVEGARWFVREVFPLIRREEGETRLALIGAAPPPDIVALGGRPGITVTGYVADIRPYLERSAVFVCPVISGGGMRGKVLEAMSMARPVVSTSRGAEGLGAVSGRDLLLADSREGFAKAVLQLMREEPTRSEMARNARSLVEARFDTGVVFPRMERLYEKFLQQRRPTDKRG